MISSTFRAITKSCTRFPLATALIVFLIISFVILRSILGSEGIPIWGDYHVPPNSEQWFNEISKFNHIWDPYSLTGRPFISLSAILSILVKLPFLLTGSPEWASKSFLLFALAIPGLGMYYMANTLNRSKLGAYLAGFLYMINPWTIDRFLSGHIEMIFAYGIIPIIFTFTYKSVTEKDYRYALLAGLFGSLVAIQLHMFYLMLVLLLIYSAFLVFSHFIRKVNVKDVKQVKSIQSFMWPLVVIAIILSINAYWIIPTLFYKVELSTHFPPEEDLEILSREASIENAFRMSTYWWQYLDNTAQVILGSLSFEIWYILSILLIFALLVTALLIRSKLVIFFSILLAIGIVLSHGLKQPFGVTYSYLFEYLPFFSAFRDPSKWTVLVALSYSYLLSLLVSHLRKNSPYKHKNTLHIQKTKAYVGLPLVFILVTNLVIPFFIDSSYNENVRTLSFPKEYRDAVMWLQSETSDYHRVALFPPDFEIKYDWAPYPIIDPVYTYPISSTIALKDREYATKDNAMAWWIYHNMYLNNTKHIADLFGLMNVKYLMVRDDAHPNSYQRGLMGFTDIKISSYMDKQEDLKLVYRNGNISIYENELYLPHIYSANNLILAVGNRNILNSLSYANYSFSQLPIVFADDLTRDEIIMLLPFTKSLLIGGDRLNDFLFNLVDQPRVISIDDYVENRQDSTRYWISSDYVLALYPSIFDAELKKFAFTSGNSRMSIPLTLSNDDTYEIWVRAYSGDSVSPIGITLEQTFVLSDHKSSSYGSFKWFRIGSIELDEGDHTIELTSHGINAISSIAVIPSNELAMERANMNSLLENYNLPAINIVEAEDLDFDTGSRIAKIDFEASRGYALDVAGGLAKTSVYVPNSQEYIIGARVSALNEHSLVNLTIDNRLLSSIPVLYSASSNFTYIYSDKVYLDGGGHEISIDSEQQLLVDQIILYPYQEDGTDFNLDSFSIREMSATEYNIIHHIPLTIFLESYSEGWKLGEVAPVPVWSYANMFVETDDHSLRFTPETYHNIGTILSISILLGTVLLLFIQKLRNIL